MNFRCTIFKHFIGYVDGERVCLICGIPERDIGKGVFEIAQEVVIENYPIRYE